MSDTDRRGSRPRRTLGFGARLASLVAIAALAPVAFLVWFATNQIEREAITRAHQVTALHASTIANTIDDRFRALTVAASAAATIVSLATPGGPAVNHDALLQTMAKQIGYETWFETFAPDGQRLGSSAPPRVTDAPSHVGFRRAAEGSNAWELSPTQASHPASVYFFAPAIDRTSQNRAVRGVVALGVETSKLDRLVRGIADYVDQTGGLATIVDRDGRSIFGPDSATTQARVAWLSQIDPSQPGPTVEIDGVAHVVGIAQSKETGWTVAITMAEPDVIAPARRVRDAAVEAGVAIGFVAVVIGVMRTSAMIAPLSELARATSALASGDASVQLPAPGSAREIDVVVAAFSDMRDRVTAWTLASDDARAAAERALKQRSAALEELERTRNDVVRRERLHAIGQVVTGLAHDFHGAISTIAGYCEIVLGHPAIRQDDARLTEVIGRIHEVSLNASELVDRIRVLSLPPPTAGAPTTGRLPVSLSTVAEEALRLVEPTITRNWDRSPVRVVTHFEPLAPILGDATALRASFANLFANAVDAMPAGGTLEVSIRRVDPNVEIVVRDTGTGMDDEVQRRCFEPFFTTKGSRGTGIGLASTRAAIESHGGAISLESALGAGTTLVVRLPVSFADIGDDAPEIVPPSSASATATNAAR